LKNLNLEHEYSIGYNIKNKSSMELEEKIQRIVENAKYCGLHSREATRQILLLLGVVGRIEQLKCEHKGRRYET